MNSSNYTIKSDSVNVGGADSASSSNYGVKDTAGEISSEKINSSNYTASIGYRHMISEAAVSESTTTEEKESSPQSGQFQPLSLSLQSVSASQNSAVVQWKTNRPTRYTIEWGVDDNYEAGEKSSNNFDTTHTVLITGLEEGITYQFKIEATDKNGQSVVLRGETLVTLSSPDMTAPAAPGNFSGKLEDGRVRLSWSNPKDPDFSSVRVVRSEEFYPQDQTDGVLVYEGTGTQVYDSEIEEGETYYYSIFARDENGNYSSGAVTQVSVPASGEVLPPEPKDIFDQFPESDDVHPKIQELTLQDFEFIQEGERIIPSENGLIPVDGSKNITVRLDYDKVPELLKTIGITLQHPQDKEQAFSFLLRINEDKTAYEATIGALEETGSYDAHITVLDYKNRASKRLNGDLVATVSHVTEEGDDPSDSEIWLLGFLFFLLTLILIVKTVEYIKKKRSRPSFVNPSSMNHEG